MASSVPTLRFLFSHPAHFVALGFGSGLAPVAPGTFGTLVAIPLAAALRNRFDDLGYAVAVVLFFVLGIGVSAVTARAKLSIARGGKTCGFGVMVDDLLAAGCTLLVLALARRVLG